MADWEKIEAEYVTTQTSYRKLAEKYGLNQATISVRAKAEDWVGKRKQHASKAKALILEKDINRKVDRVERIKSVSDKLLERVEDMLEQEDKMSASAIKNLSDAIRNVKDAQMLRTEEDILEQKARIDKLRQEINKQDEDRSITITLEGLTDYAK